MFSKYLQFECSLLKISAEELYSEIGGDKDQSFGEVVNLPCHNWNSTGPNLKTPQAPPVPDDKEYTIISSYEVNYTASFLEHSHVEFKYRASMKMMDSE